MTAALQQLLNPQRRDYPPSYRRWRLHLQVSLDNSNKDWGPIGGHWVSHIPLMFGLHIPYPVNSWPVAKVNGFPTRYPVLCDLNIPLIFTLISPTPKTFNTGADPGFFLGGSPPLRNGVTAWWGKQILKANTKKKASSQRWGCAPPAPST